MALTHTGETSEHVVVLSAVNVVEINSFSSFDNDRYGWIIWSAVLGILIDELLSLLGDGSCGEGSLFDRD